MGKARAEGMSSPVDLRSDTVTRPTPDMRRAIARAKVGDDVFGDDPTVKALEEKVANLLGKERALFVPSGTMGNAVAVKIHTRPGDEAIVEAGSHHFNYEAGSAAFLSGVQLHPLSGTRGVITAEQVEAAIRPADSHFPRSRLVCVENTHNREGGTIFPLREMRRLRGVADRHGLSLHLDGARLWNASVATGIAPARYAASFDTVLVCLSKGLGAPVGSLLAGSRSLIEEARRVRKVFGGGMRQAGILAAAGIYAIDHHWSRMAEDHANAKLLAQLLAGLPGVDIDPAGVETNIVVLRVHWRGGDALRLVEALKELGVLAVELGPDKLRAVTHLDVNAADIRRAARAFERLLDPRSRPGRAAAAAGFRS